MVLNEENNWKRISTFETKNTKSKRCVYNVFIKSIFKLYVNKHSNGIKIKTNCVMNIMNVNNRKSKI